MEQLPQPTRVRVADQLLDQYLKTKPGTTQALRLLRKSREAARQNQWIVNTSHACEIPSRRTFRRLQHLSEQEMDTAVEMYYSGQPLANICKRLNVCNGTLEKLFDHRGVTRKRRRYIDARAVHELREQGMTIDAIAFKLSCHRQTVLDKLKRFRQEGAA